MYLKELQEIGLDEKEARVYLASLELGEATAQRIAQKSDVKRATVYRIIEDLKKKGLMGEYKKTSGAVFFAENPKKLKEKTESAFKIANNILPGLFSLSNLIDKKPKIRYFDGKEEIRELYLETLKFTGQEIVAWESGTAYETYGESFWDEKYIPKRIENKIWTRIIYSDIPVGREHKEKDLKSLREIRIDKNTSIKIQIKLFEKRFSAFVSEKEMIGLIIESQAIFDTLKGIFEIHWSSLVENKNQKTYLA